MDNLKGIFDELNLAKDNYNKLKKEWLLKEKNIKKLKKTQYIKDVFDLIVLKLHEFKKENIIEMMKNGSKFNLISLPYPCIFDVYFDDNMLKIMMEAIDKFNKNCEFELLLEINEENHPECGMGYNITITHEKNLYMKKYQWIFLIIWSFHWFAPPHNLYVQ